MWNQSCQHLDGRRQNSPEGKPGVAAAWLHLQAVQRHGTPWWWPLGTGGSSDGSPVGEEIIPFTQRTPKMARLEAALFVATEALSARRLMQVAMLPSVSEVRRLVEQLNQAYDATGSAFRIESVARGYRLLTRPQYAPWLQRQFAREAQVKLSPPAMETLTIIAYRQPITRADIEAIRGVQCADIIKQLMDRGLVRIAGEDNSLGRPFLYATTRKFLEVFGLNTLDDLPMADQLRRKSQDTTPENEPLEADEDLQDENLPSNSSHVPSDKDAPAEASDNPAASYKDDHEPPLAQTG